MAGASGQAGQAISWSLFWTWWVCGQCFKVPL